MNRPLVGVAAFCVLALVPSAALAGEDTHAVHAKLRQIESAILRGEVGAVRLKYQDEARARPGDVMVRVYLAWCEMPADEAWNQLKGVAQIYPDHPWARLGMGRVYLRWKMRDLARKEFEAALVKDPRFYPALVGLADTARAENALDEAIAGYRKALAIAPEDPEALAGLGLSLEAKGDRPGAKAALAKSVAGWADQPKVLSELSRIAREEKDVAAAAQWAEKVADLNPRNAQARRTLADLRYELGDRAGAAQAYALAMRLGDGDEMLFTRLAELHRESGNLEGEQRAVEQLSALHRKDATYPVRMAEILAARGKLDEAEMQLLEAMSRAPERSELGVRLAQVRVKRKQYRDALDAYRVALAREKNAEAEAEAKTLAAKFSLPKSPAKGSVDAIYAKVSKDLLAVATAAQKENPALAGMIKVRVRVNADGTVAGADLLEDTVGDPWVVGHVYFQLKDAKYPKKKREPIFEFEIKPAKGK